MASLESKILDGKAAGYCSSSEDEGDDAGGFKPINDEDEHQARVMRQFGGQSEQTGAKGVLKDHEEFVKEQGVERARDRQRAVQEAKRGMLSGRAAEESDEEKEEAEGELALLRARRLAEMRKQAAGKVIELSDQNELLHAIESTPGLLAVLIYEPRNELSGRVSILCKQLAGEYGAVRFARITATTAGMSARFISEGVPALQLYESGELVCNLVQLGSLVGEEPSLTAIRALLIKNRISLRMNRRLEEDESDDSEE